ncbi:M16 family metallopeptidase [Pedobacter antarcticus]|uniref:M16 family metallopeptidase n=1 Tax=Pedobacter antarcticus TaxID=34086 RepID=UPI00292FC86D|nr:insulinase family protein [Pedobacter antarcticus]
MLYQYNKFLIGGLFIALSMPGPLAAQTKKAAAGLVDKSQTNPVLALDPAVRLGKLPNGFSYYIRHNNEPENRVVFYLANKVGSILETDEQQGLAHFMEHMSFNGTKHFPKNKLVDYLQKSGIRFGADINAYTSFDETVYQLPLPANDAELIKNGIQIMRDWAQDVTLETEEINNERGVVLEEKRLREGASQRLQSKTMPIMLNQSKYAYRLPIGTDEVLTKFKPDAIRSYYRDWYRPNLQALIVVGDINIDEMEKMIKAKFSDLKNPEKEKARTKFGVNLTGKNQFLSISDPELTTTSLQLMIKHKAPELKTEADYRNAIISNLFNQIMSERYVTLSRQEAPPFLQGSAGIQRLMGGLDAYIASVAVGPGELEKGFKALWRETRRVQVNGFTQTELDRAKKNYMSGIDAALKEKGKIPSESYVKEYLEHFLRQVAAPGIVREHQITARLLSEISLKDMKLLVDTYIKESNRDIILQAPEKEKAALPNETTVLAWIKSVNDEKPEPFSDEVNKLALLTGQPVPGKIINQEQTEPGLTVLTLSNGIKILLKKTSFQDNQILFSGFSNGGSSLYSDADFQSAASASALISSAGVGNYNATQLQKYLTGKNLNVSPFIGELSQGFNGSSAPEDLESALQLLYGYFTEPRKDESLYKGQINRAIASMANRADDPSRVFSDTVTAVLGNYSPRRTALSVEKIHQISLDRAFEIYKERFSDASSMTFTFVGNIDEQSIRPLLEKYLGSLPAKGLKEESKDLGIQIPLGKISKTVYKGTAPKSTVYLVFSGAFDYSYENNLKMAALQEALEIRLLERLREQESGVYSPSVQIRTNKIPQSRFSLTISFGCAPANVEKLIASTLDEINTLKHSGPAPENIDKFKAEDRLSRETSLKSNGFWLNYLNGQLMEGEPLNQLFLYELTIDKITVPAVREIAKKYISNQDYIRIVLLPENEKK